MFCIAKLHFQNSHDHLPFWHILVHHLVLIYFFFEFLLLFLLNKGLLNSSFLYLKSFQIFHSWIFLAISDLFHVLFGDESLINRICFSCICFCFTKRLALHSSIKVFIESSCFKVFTFFLYKFKQDLKHIWS